MKDIHPPTHLQCLLTGGNHLQKEGRDEHHLQLRLQQVMLHKPGRPAAAISLPSCLLPLQDMLDPTEPTECSETTKGHAPPTSQFSAGFVTRITFVLHQTSTQALQDDTGLQAFATAKFYPTSSVFISIIYISHRHENYAGKGYIWFRMSNSFVSFSHCQST